MAFFGMPLFPASLFLHLEPLLSKIRVTWMQASTVIPHSGSHDPAATEGLTGRSLHSAEMLEKGAVHIPGGTEKDGMRFHHNTQHCMQFKTYDDD